MSRITDIKPQKFSKGGPRFNIFIDEKFAFGLPAETLVKAGLKIDQDISPSEIDKLIKENDFIRVYDLALKFLSFRPRSEKELNDWFSRKQIGEETKKMADQKLKKYGYVNDEEFAKWWIEQRMEFKASGKKLLRMELKQKGIPEEIITRLLDGYIAKNTEIELARKVVEKKMKILKGLSKQEIRQKLTQALARRGFSWEVTKQVIDEKIGKGYNPF